MCSFYTWTPESWMQQIRGKMLKFDTFLPMIAVQLRFGRTRATRRAASSGCSRRSSARRRAAGAPRGACCALHPPARLATRSNKFRGSFSAGSTPIFASKYAFCSIFQDLQENHLLASKFAKCLQIFSEFCKFSRNL